MSSRKKLKLLKKQQGDSLPNIPPPPPTPTIEEINQGTSRAVNMRLQILESAALNLDDVLQRFQPPDPAGPPNKHVLLHIYGVDFLAIELLRERTKRMLKALREFERISRYVTDHPNEPLPSPWPPPKKAAAAAPEPAPA